VKSDRVRWGLVGTARINERLMPALRAAARSELVAVGSRDRDKAAAYAAKWNIPRAHGSYDALLADPNVDAVYLSLPNGLHVDWIVRAAAAGKHILCEKPLACSVAEVDRAIEAARRHGVLLQEAVMMRFHPQTHELRRLVQTGAIGDVRLIRGVFAFALERPGDIRFDPALGGGSIWDLGSYPVGFIRTLLGANPVEVHGWRRLGPEGGASQAVDLSFAGRLRFASGAVGEFFSSFEAAPHSEADLLGSAGKMKVELPFVNKVGVAMTTTIFRRGAARAQGAFSDAAPFTTETLTYENVNAYQNEVDSMVASILDGAPLVVTPEDSRDNVAALEALCRSAETGLAVRMG
jgi:predicted dehydrogenase